MGISYRQKAGPFSFRFSPRLLDPSAPSPLAGEGAPLNWRPSADAVAGNGWDGGEQHRLGMPPAFTPTLALFEKAVFIRC